MKGKGFRLGELADGLEARGEVVQVVEKASACLYASRRDWKVEYENGTERQYWTHEKKSWQFLWWLFLGALNESETKHVNQPNSSTSAGLRRRKGAYTLRLRARVLRNGMEKRVPVPVPGVGVGMGRIFLMESG